MGRGGARRGGGNRGAGVRLRIVAPLRRRPVGPGERSWPPLSRGAAVAAFLAPGPRMAAPAAVPGPCALPTGRQAAARGRQAALWSRARRLRRRLRALQARQVERHVRQQLAGLARHLGRVGPGGLPPALGPDLRLLAASATARLRATQGACDSDATGSSSGSGEESEAEGDGQRSLAAACPGRHHAECQWATERAAIICRWTWLQAQISDLEYRIRQQTDIYKQLRAAKGPVVLGGDWQPGDLTKKQGRLGSVSLVTSKKNKWLSPSSSVPRCPAGDAAPSRFLYNMQKQSSHLTQSLGNPACRSPSCTPISGSPAPLRACAMSPRQANGVFNCLPTGSSGSSSLISVNVEERFGKQSPINNPVAVSDNTCVAARIRPVCKHKKRKLVRATSVSHFGRKPLKPLTVKCSCEWPNSCILCSCKASVQTIDPDTMSLEERIALLDSGFHPVLSLSHGNPLHLHFETLLREDRLHRLLSHGLKTLKLSHFGKKEDPTNSAFPKLHSSLLLASCSLFEGRRQLEGTSSHSFPVSSPQAHKYDSLHHPPSLYPETPPAPSSSQIPFTGSSAMQSSKRRKAKCSYSIDNVVIPVSMAAAARVEKPQYKEIVVPSWRIVELEELEPFNQADSELEDTSDEMYLSHHSKYEDLERACWDSWAAATSHKRGSRSFNKADSRWAGQPQPVSPLTGFNCLNDLCMHPSTGLHSPETCNTLQSLSVHGRTRTVLSCSEDARSSLEMLDDAIQNIQPWDPRVFPLSDSAYQGLLQQSGEGGDDRADLQPWVSSNKRGIGPTPVDAVIPRFTGMQFSDMHPQTDGNKSIQEFMVQHCNPGKLVNSAKPDLQCV
ncbi:KAT8 regulatory NSL complex subunit 1-like [Pelecanus crispus]|uniref:KAT8 regulatory NSL complex subunit 1-like n=1 Tax=Pelecanus crispus TaxID=36300 RepID=UPI003F5D2BF3